MKEELLDYIRTIYRNVAEITEYVEENYNISITYTISWKGLDGSVKLYENYHMNVNKKDFTSYNRNTRLGGLLEEEDEI